MWSNFWNNGKYCNDPVSYIRITKNIVLFYFFVVVNGYLERSDQFSLTFHYPGKEEPSKRPEKTLRDCYCVGDSHLSRKMTEI